MNSKYINGLALTAISLIAVNPVSAQAASSNSMVVPDIVLLWSLLCMAGLLILVNLVLRNTIRGLTSDKSIWKTLAEKSKTGGGAAIILLIGFMLLDYSGMAQADVQVKAPFIMGNDLFYALLTMNALLLGLLFYQIHVMRSLIHILKNEPDAEADSIVETWTAALTDFVPIEQEEEIMFEHEHDGIRELDNNLPPWWLYGFYFTIVFAVVYSIHFLITPIPGFDKIGIIGPGVDQETLYEMEMAEAEVAKAEYLANLSDRIDENNVEASTDPSTLASGREIWAANCVTCHGDGGEGGIGPNMTDEFWIHGGGIKNIFKTIKYGVPSEGMISWEAQLSPGQMASVASYILSLKGTNPPNPKEPEGEIWKAEIETAPADSSISMPQEAPAGEGEIPMPEKDAEVEEEATTNS